MSVQTVQQPEATVVELPQVTGVPDKDKRDIENLRRLANEAGSYLGKSPGETLPVSEVQIQAKEHGYSDAEIRNFVRKAGISNADEVVVPERGMLFGEQWAFNESATDDSFHTDLVDAASRATQLRETFVASHPNERTIWETSDEERAEQLEAYLTAIENVCPAPRLLPLDDSGKAPAIKGTCPLDSEQGRKMLRTPEEAVEELRHGASGFALYAGREDHGTENLVFADHDDLDAFPLDTLPDTLTVVSGSGEGYHETFVNAGDVENASSNGGEMHAENLYVVLPGSIHPSGGIYHVSEERPVVELEADDVPERLHPATSTGSDEEDFDIPDDWTGNSFTNELGRTLDEVREYDEQLDELLSTPPRPDVKPEVQDDNVIDAQLVWRLRFHHFERNDIIRIWRQYRSRKKLERNDYVTSTIKFAGTHDVRCRYDGSEQSVSLLDTSSDEWDWQDAASDEEPDITLGEARDRCQERIIDALRNGEHTLIAALPAMGKSSGVIRGAAQTDTPVTILTARHDLYDQYEEWCEEQGLSYHRLPAFHEDCPTGRGDHSEEWKDRVQSLYEKGATASEIHKQALRHFDEPLPCDDGHECPYKLKWDFEESEYDVLIGHYQHAYTPTVVEDRTVVFDEFPEDAFLEELESGTVSEAVSAYLTEHDSLPFEDLTSLIEARNTEQAESAREWFEGQELEPDGSLVFTDETDAAHAYAPLIVYALLVGEDLGNSWEHADLDSKASIDNHRLAARNRETGNLYLLRPPNLDDARSVIGLDGTPTPDLWQRTVNTRLSHAPVLSDEERAAYLTDALQLSIVQTTEAVKPYSSGNYVNPEKDLLLFEAVAEEKNTEPALISTNKAITQYEQESVLDTVGERTHYGNLKGSNHLENEHVGIVAGSRHFGDNYVKRWGALCGKAVERDGRGDETDYGEFGNKLLQHMREHELLQAVLRFGRNNSPTTIYVHTSALPDWVPLEAEREVVQPWSEGTQKLVEALNKKAPGEWRTAEIAEDVSLSERQVRENLGQLADSGYVEKRKEGRGYMWVVEADDVGQLEKVEFREI